MEAPSQQTVLASLPLPLLLLILNNYTFSSLHAYHFTLPHDISLNRFFVLCMRNQPPLVPLLRSLELIDKYFNFPQKKMGNLFAICKKNPWRLFDGKIIWLDVIHHLKNKKLYPIFQNGVLVPFSYCTICMLYFMYFILYLCYILAYVSVDPIGKNVFLFGEKSKNITRQTRLLLSSVSEILVDDYIFKIVLFGIEKTGLDPFSFQAKAIWQRISLYLCHSWFGVFCSVSWVCYCSVILNYS